ncbi:MAG: VCBS repeat-containing protein, partial [Candidatus Altiarchaeota archaeon]|nr:VCBS repeat-containing protein [Candidatus Altiarchaeota archaeon]
MRKAVFMVLAALLLSPAVYAQQPNLIKKWSYTTPYEIGAVEVADFNGDGKSEIVLATIDNQFYVMDGYSNIIGTFKLGNASVLGRVYSLAAWDVNKDGINELVAGLGGAKEVITYPIRGYDVTPGGGISTSDKSLYRTTRFYGGVYVLSINGALLWNYSDITSVRAVYPTSINGTTQILAGIGDHNSFIYAEATSTSFDENYCRIQNYSNELMGWSERDLCLDRGLCCSGLLECTCRWDAVNELCYGTYEIIECTTEPTSADQWVFKEYLHLNGTILVLNSTGSVKSSYTFSDSKYDTNIRSLFAYDLDGDGIKEVIVGLNYKNFSVMDYNPLSSSFSQRWVYEADSDVRIVYAGDITGDNLAEVIVGTNGGFIIVLDYDGNLLWKSRVDDILTGIAIIDIDGDESNEIVITSRDKNIYVFSSDGTLKWKQFVGYRLYSLKFADLDGNGLKDLVVSSTTNVTRYELNEFYIKKNQADIFYSKAYANYNNNRLTE